MRIINQAEVSSNIFPIQQETSQASMDFLFLLFLQLLQSRTELMYSFEGSNTYSEGMGSQDTNSNYQRALRLIEENPSLKDTFHQAVTFIFLLSQFLSNKQIVDKGPGQDEGVIPRSLKAQNLPPNLFFTSEGKPEKNQSLSLTSERGSKPLILSQDAVQSLSDFISKAWKKYKTLLKGLDEGSNPNFQYVKKEFNLKVNAEWESLPADAKAYLKEVFTNLFANQEKRIGKANTEEKPNLSINNSSLNGKGLQDLAPGKNVKLGEGFQGKTSNTKEAANTNSQMAKESMGHIEVDRTPKQETKVGFISDGEERHSKGESILKGMTEKVELRGSERESLFLFSPQTREELNNLAMNTSNKGQLNSPFRHRVAMQELPNFVRSIVVEVLPQGEHRARMELFPPELGHVDLEVRVQNGEVSVVGKLENSQAYQDILREVPVIRTHLEELGLKVKELVFTLTSGDANLTYQGERQPRENRKGLAERPNGRHTTQVLPREEGLINHSGRYYYIV